MKYLILFLFCATAHSMIYSPGELRGTALMNLTERQSFSFEPGEVGACEKKGSATMIVYKCKMKSAGKAILKNSRGESFIAHFDRLTTLHQTYKGETTSRYLFRGQWKETKGTPPLGSEVELDVARREKAPKSVYGLLRLRRYGVSAAIEADIVDAP